MGAAARDGTLFCLCGYKPHSWNGILIMMMITMIIAIMETEKLRIMIKIIEAMKLTKNMIMMIIEILMTCITTRMVVIEMIIAIEIVAMMIIIELIPRQTCK